MCDHIWRYLRECLPGRPTKFQAVEAAKTGSMTRAPAKLPKLTPVDRGTIQERVYQKLREALMQGRFSPGDPVTLRALANALGTSSMPVREALRQLVAEQALVIKPNRSVIVPLLSAERLDEVRRIRVALEGMMAEEAADKISPADVERLQQLHEDMCGVVAAGEIKRYLARNQEFHFTIYAAADMPTTLRIIESLWLQVGPVMNFLLTKEARVREAGPGEDMAALFEENHLGAVKALRGGDGPAARRAITNDINDAADYLLSLRYFDHGARHHGEETARRARRA